MDRTKLIALLLCVLMGPVAYGEHSPLLPRPQQVQYGPGQIPIHGLAISFALPPSGEDRFAAGELSSWIQQRTGLEVPIESYGNGNDGKLTILLDREGVRDEQLALPGDKPGPDSRRSL